METRNIDLAELFETTPALAPLMDTVQEIMEFPEDKLVGVTADVISGMVKGAFTDKVKEDSINEVITGFDSNGLNRVNAIEAVDEAKRAMSEYIDALKPSPSKRQILESIFQIFYDIFDEAIDRYHNYNIVLPIVLDEGATVPTYAHDTDACADLYAADDITLSAHTFSNMVRTGVHIALPEGWMAMIFPRSSIGAKTQNRLSNSVGIIDSEYRGQLGVLYDNLSDSDYEIKAGDRVAQMLVMPSYKFKANVVDILPASDRGEGGFGSTGK